MEERFILGQQALTPDGAVYQMIMDMPYEPNTAPELVAQFLLPTATPKDAIAGSTCIYNTEDADGYPVEWLFAFDGTNWALERVVRGGSAGGGGGGGEVPIFVAHQDMTVTCETSYSDFVSILKTAGLKDTSEEDIYPCVMDMHEVDGADSVLTAILTKQDIINADMGNGYFIVYDGEGIRVEGK